MGKVSDHIIDMITKRVAKSGIVVWYDPEGAYAKLADQLSLPDTEVLRFEESFFALKEKLEAFLEWIDASGKPRLDAEIPPKVVVYVPKAREKTEYALIEAEQAGVVMEPGANPWQRNTRLKVIAEHVFREIAPGQAAEIAKKVEQGILSLEELDRMADQAAEVAAGGVKLIFGTDSPVEVALQFATAAQHDEAIASKQVMPQLADLFRSGLGIDIGQESGPAAIRTRLRRGLLASDFVAALDPAAPPRELAPLVSTERLHLERCREVCHNWRNRSDLRESYIEAARHGEQELRIPAIEVPLTALESAETFPSIERKLLGHAEDLLLAGDAIEASKLAERRRQSFWSVIEPACGLRWSVLEAACRVLTVARKIQNDLRQSKLEARSIIDAYVGGPEPWSLLDTHYRQMERRYAKFSAEINEAEDKLRDVIQKARRAYSEAVTGLTEVWTEALAAPRFRVDGVRGQERVFRDYVAPALREGQRVAYFLVDALRFEMGRELAGSLADEFEVEIHPALSKLPSITEIGMAALLPGADEGLEVAEEKGGKLVVRVGGEALRDRAARLDYLGRHAGVALLPFKLGEISKPAANRKLQDDHSGLIVVTSQEIDQFGEMAEDEDETRAYMDDVLDKLSRAVRRLANLGVERFVIAADHGHLYGETIEAGMKMDPPGGRTLSLGRREWIGQGGTSGDGFMRVRGSEIGLAGDVELAFPRGLAIFKSKGGSDTYLHGGASLQEMVIPIIVLRKKAGGVKTGGMARIDIKMERPRITTRFFSVALTYKPEGLFGDDNLSVRLNVTSGKKEAGRIVMAAYGFNEGSGEVRLEKDKTNSVTVMLTEEGLKSVSVVALDAASQVELARLDNVPVEITIE